MTKKTRYLLLFFGFLIFIVLAPLIVLYVRGITYDIGTKTFVTTGILAIRAEPKDAAIYLNGKQKKDSSGDIKFVIPGEYDVAVKKEGYQTWHKRLTIQPGQVTWASPAFNKIFLPLEMPATQQLADNVSTFYVKDGSLAFLTLNELSLAGTSDPASTKRYPLPEGISSIILADSGMENLILSDATSTQTFLFKKSNGKFYDLTGLFTGQVKFNFNNGDLFALNAGTFYAVDYNKKIKTALFQNLKAASFQDGWLYFIKHNDKQESLTLMTSQAPFSSSQSLYLNIPSFSEGELFITYEKQIFLLADQTLYQVNSTMEKVADNISYSNFQNLDSIITIIHSGQADYFDPLAKNFNYVTRTSDVLKNLQIRAAVGQAFFSVNGNINAIELDTRDRQNQYLLYKGNAQQFWVDQAAKNIILLDGGILKSLAFR